MKQSQELWYNTLNLVSDKDLVAIQLNLVALHIDVVLDAWEVEDTRQVEWEVNVEVNPEQWLVLHRIEGAIETLVVLVLQCARSLGPERFHIINNIVLVCLHALTILPFCLLAESYRHSHKLAVLVEQILYLALL